MILLDRYIRHEMILSTFFVSMVLLAIQSFLIFIQELRYVGEAQYDLWQAIIYVLMQLPADYYQLFPIAGFLGCLIGLGRLAQSSQLVVMRASGVSIVRIAWSVIKTALLMILVATILGEVIGPILQQQAQTRHDAALQTTSKQLLGKSIWLREGNVFTHIQKIVTDHFIEGVTRYIFDAQGHLAKATFADSGQLTQGAWILSHLNSTVFQNNHTRIETVPTERVALLLKPTIQVRMEAGTTEQSLKELYRTIQYQRATGLNTNASVFSWYQRLFQPLASLIMISLGVLFVFGALRSHTLGSRILMGVILGFGFYMLNQLFGPISLVYQFPPILAAIMPTFIFLGIFLLLLARAK